MDRMPYRRRGSDRSDSSNDSSNSSSSSKSSKSSIFKRRSHKPYEQEAIAEERAARPQQHQWKCPRYNLTWEVLEEFLGQKFPSETFEEFQSGDYWIFNAPKAQTQKDLDEFGRLRPRPQTLRRPKTPE